MSLLSQEAQGALRSALCGLGPAREVSRALIYPQFNGTDYYVCSVTGSDTSAGVTPGAPLATIAAAMTLCTANKGDKIHLLSGHTETYSTTGSKLTTKAGVKIIAYGTGADRATFTFSHTGATWTVSGAGSWIENVLFVCGVDSVTTYGTVSGVDVTFHACEFRDTTDVEVITDLTVTGDRFTFSNCFKNGYVGGNANVRVLSLNGVDDALIANCRFRTKVTTAVVGFVTAACTNVVINNCVFMVDSTTNFSKNVVDTITGSTWAVSGNSFDIPAGQFFGGGSGAALAGVSISAITDALYGANGISSYPASAAPANGVSVAEVLGWMNDALQGSAGVVTFPAAAAPANGVSLAEVERAIYNAVAASPTASSNGVNTALGRRVDRSTADVITGSAVPIFTVSGGRVLLTCLIGEVTTIIGAGSSNAKFQFNPTTGTTVDLCANLDIDADEAGTLYSIDGTPATAMLTSQSGAVRNMQNNGIILDIGDIEFLGGTDRTGSIAFQLWYIPLDDAATVAAA